MQDTLFLKGLGSNRDDCSTLGSREIERIKVRIDSDLLHCSCEVVFVGSHCGTLPSMVSRHSPLCLPQLAEQPSVCSSAGRVSTNCCGTFLTESLDQNLVIAADIQLRRAGIALATAPTHQLPIDPCGSVRLAYDDVQSTCLCNNRIKLNVSTATGHVCSNRNSATATGLGNDRRLLPVMSRVENDVSDSCMLERFTKLF